MNKEAVFEVIVGHVREVLPHLQNHSFAPTDQLAQLGANSVDRAEIVNMVLDSLALRIPRVELFGARNLGELADLLHQRLGRQ